MALIKRQKPRPLIGKVHDSFYDSPQWRRLRKAFFSTSLLCDYCKHKGIASVAKFLDHLLNRKMWPELEWDETNLKRACPTCDNRKRQIEGQHQHKENLLSALREGGFYL